jgi:hypothetical protein
LQRADFRLLAEELFLLVGQAGDRHPFGREQRLDDRARVQPGGEPGELDRAAVGGD